MRKKDMKLNFHSKKGKRGYSDSLKKVSRMSKRSKLFLLVIVFAFVTGITTYVIANKKQNNELSMRKSEEHQGENGLNLQGQKQLVIGPYGIGGNLAKDLSINDTEEIVDVWMNGFIENRTPTKVKGIYVTASKANNSVDDLIALVDETELNTMVIDVKDDEGRITYLIDYQDAKEINATRSYISDIDGLIKKLKNKNIYLIARVVAFKDPLLAKERPELSLKKKDGTVFRDKDGLAWVNPYKKEVWDYLVGIATQCAAVGFDEVNFDYIRFSTDSGMKQVDFGEEASNKTKIDIITEFVKYACTRLRTKKIYISADVYGAIINSSVDAKIVGQSYLEMSRYLDYICPMIYPSHYGNGYYGIDYPDTQPYELIIGALESSKSVLKDISERNHKAIVRPWLQDFTASWLKHYIKYGEKEVREQIEAVYDSGYEEWLLWNGAMNYTKDALMTESDAKEAMKNRKTPVVTPITKQEEVLPSNSPDYNEFIVSPWKSGK